MKLLKRHISKTILSAIGLVTLILAGLQIFILFINQLSSVGKGDFGLLQTTLYVFLQLPYQVYLFFPLASLLGCLIGLGIMASQRELIVMRAAGVSVGQITETILKTAIILILFVTVLGEIFIPKLTQWGNDQKMQAISGGRTLRTPQGVWLRHKQDFILIGTVLPDNSLRQVFQFKFDEQGQMRVARKINQIDYSNHEWKAYEVDETLINQDKTEVRHFAEIPWDVNIKPRVLNVSNREPDEMGLKELHRYLQAQKHSYQNTSGYQLAYWQRLMQPLSTIVMMMLAIPFIFGPLRSSTMGAKIVAGATVGFGFHIMNHFLGPISQVFQWSPQLAAIAPTCVFALLGIAFIRQVR